MRRLLVPVLALLALAAPAQAAPSACQSSHLRPSHENLRQVEQTVLCLLNAERTKRGLPRLRDDDKLGRAAAKHSKDMVSRDFFSHDSPGGTSPGDRVKRAGYLAGARGWSVGENIAWGTGSYATPQSIVRSWMNSAGHKRNILHRGFDEIGVGIALGAPGHEGGATYTTNFGSRL
jgi:uncharacterized protein YkwD